MADTFREIDSRPIWWTDKDGVTHVCEGANVHPDIRLIWTLCEIDVPGGEAYLPATGDYGLSCSKCILVPSP